jgi:hypothetical protein
MRRMRRSRSCFALTYGLGLGLSTKVLAKSPGQRWNFSSGEKSNSRLVTGEREWNPGEPRDPGRVLPSVAIDKPDGLLGTRDLAVVGRVWPAVTGRPWLTEPPARGDRDGDDIFAVPGRLVGVRGRDVKSERN